MFLTWIITGIILLIVEFSTVNFVSIFFSIGCFVSSIASLFILSIEIQIIMCLFSVIGVIFGRKVLQKYFEVNKEIKPSTINALIGKIGIVVKEITKDEMGIVKIEGELWSTIFKDLNYIHKDANIKTINIDGVKLIVERI